MRATPDEMKDQREEIVLVFNWIDELKRLVSNEKK